MDPQILDFLYFNGIVVLILVLYMAFWRPKRQPTPLKLRNEQNNKVRSAGENKAVAQERILNVIFQYNGHDFDAYEVFGLPAGSSLSAVEQAYRQVISRTDVEDQTFYNHAFEAIKKSI
jgi:hypothetical protein